MFVEKKDCCGCSACYVACPLNAIAMVADKEGFLYPEIDKKRCINCSICQTVCSFQNGYQGNKTIHAYALKHKDIQIRNESQSGGVFTLLSDWILSKNGVVYGAEFSQNYTVHHSRANSVEKRNRFRGSKYVQSNLKNCFFKVRNDLLQGIPVLFSGTACQIEGLNQYLKINKVDITQLYTVDIVCHGVPSNKIWLDYLNYVLKRNGGSKIEKVYFRDKAFGWASHYESIWIDGQKYSVQDFNVLFSEACVLRPSCHQCIYTNFNRPADFTIGDFWGIDDILDDFNDNKGVSLFLINSKKGVDLFQKVKQQAEYVPVEIERCSFKNPNLRMPTQEPIYRTGIWKVYEKRGFNAMLLFCKWMYFFGRVKRKLMKIGKFISR